MNESAAPPSLSDFIEQARDGDGETVALAFVEGVAAQGFELYPAQEQAILELMSDNHVILSTPTGSGKSLVAFALVFRAVAQGKRVFYTAPIKALVSEKFFQLCEQVGAEHVGMMTGDASVNRDAPVICCTAEILANLCLAPPEETAIDFVVMDEFHYYGDRDRGAAWQIPLIARPDAQYLLMSATLGDTREIEDSLTELSGREVVRVASVERPVPLEFEYVETPLHETISELVREAKAPIYLVNFTQREAAEQVQNLTSLDVTPKETKKRIQEELKGFRFDSPYGKDVQRYVRHGLGLHHAGLLPKYRRLVEQLAQAGLLKIVSGTDTLGVGINIPIRTVLFTKLFKFDGEKLGILSARDFKQIAGRAGRKGYDDAGTVVCEAPEYVIENRKVEMKIAANPQKKKKLQKKKPPDRNFVNWNEQTYRQLVDKQPEPLESRFRVTYAMLIAAVQHYGSTPGAALKHIVQLIERSHGGEELKRQHFRTAKKLYKSLRDAGIIRVIRNRKSGNRVVIDEELQRDFSLNHTLSLYLVAALEVLDGQSEDYALDVLSLVESILENPRAILIKQIDLLKTERLAELKAAGVEYEERMEELDKVEPPKPRAELIYETFNAFSVKHPWVREENIRPKSIARDLFERCMSFREYVKEYKLERSEGLVLRYLSDAYKTLVQTVPERFKTEAVEEIEIYLRSLLDVVDNSLVTEWEALVNPEEEDESDSEGAVRRVSFDPRRDKKRFLARIRAEMNQVVRALSRQDYATASTLFCGGEEGEYSDQLARELGPYFEEYRQIDFGPRARQTDRTTVVEHERNHWRVTQTLVDENEDLTWAVHGEVVIDSDFRLDRPLVRLVRVGT
ncbi:MAG: DUF3516 domain-containing protein [Myxococcota bacterium]